MEQLLPEVHHQVIIGMLVLHTTEVPVLRIEQSHLQEAEARPQLGIPPHLTAPQVEALVVVLEAVGAAVAVPVLEDQEEEGGINSPFFLTLLLNKGMLFDLNLIGFTIQILYDFN